MKYKIKGNRIITSEKLHKGDILRIHGVAPVASYEMPKDTKPRDEFETPFGVTRITRVEFKKKGGDWELLKD